MHMMKPAKQEQAGRRKKKRRGKREDGGRKEDLLAKHSEERLAQRIVRGKTARGTLPTFRLRNTFRGAGASLVAA